MKFHVIIPARFASSRLPAKMLADIHGKPLIQHVYERAIQSNAASVTIATDHEQIQQVAENFGAQVCLTATSHNSGTERMAEAAEKLGFDDDEIVVNVQGDQPLVPVSTINLAAQALQEMTTISMSTIAAPIKQRADLFDPNIAKVVRDKQGCALYFSRALIPWNRDALLAEPSGASIDLQHYYQHMGLYAYRVGFIKRYLTWEASPLENIEMLEQLRVLWHGEKIYVAITDEKIPPEVNTQADLELVREWNE